MFACDSDHSRRAIIFREIIKRMQAHKYLRKYTAANGSVTDKLPESSNFDAKW